MYMLATDKYYPYEYKNIKNTLTKVVHVPKVILNSDVAHFPEKIYGCWDTLFFLLLLYKGKKMWHPSFHLNYFCNGKYFSFSSIRTKDAVKLNRKTQLESWCKFQAVFLKESFISSVLSYWCLLCSEFGV